VGGAGQIAVFTAIIRSTAAVPWTLGGTVTFTIDGTTQAPSGVLGGIAILVTSGLSVGPHTVGAVYGGDGHFFTSAASPLRTLARPAAILGVQVNDSAPQRSTVTSLVVRVGTGTVGAFTLTDGLGRARTGDLGIAVSAATVVGANRTVQLTFTGAATSFGSLPDGYYQLHYNGAVTPIAMFFRLFGDSNGDSAVTGADQTAFQAAYRSRTGMRAYRAYFDYNDDALIDSVDNLAFLQRYKTRLNRDGTITRLP